MLTPDGLGAGEAIGLSMGDAAGRLERLGFVVVNGAAPGRPGGANLVVALRPTPTLAHFDPELVQYWESAGGRGRLVDLSRNAPLPLHRPYAWGTIRVIDRLNAFNSFLSFGGGLRVEAVTPDLAVAVFASPAPIVRWTGHSQEADPMAGAVGAFFAEIRAPIDFQPGAEALVAAASPVTLYALLLARLERRYGASDVVRDSQPDWAEEIEREARRVRESTPDEWQSAIALARDLGLHEG
ncbi:MAG: hypothetical protein MUC54_05300 [Chloroflexi bacterium]|nr:hypothetical protein [Chloroflexota bacterium]